MAIAKLRVGDHVKVIAGKDKGKTGKIIKMKDASVFVEGVNLVKKSVKRDPQQNNHPSEGYKVIESAIHRSNVVLYDVEKSAAVKVAIKAVDGKRVRVNRKTGETIVHNVEAK